MAGYMLTGFHVASFADLDGAGAADGTGSGDMFVGKSLMANSGKKLAYTTAMLDYENNDLNPYLSEGDTGSLVIGGKGSVIDSAFEYRVSVVYVNGTVMTDYAVVLQDASGRLLVIPHDGIHNGGYDGNSPITSIRFEEVTSHNMYSGGAYSPAAPVNCFTPDTPLDAPGGARPAGGLQPGDRLLTLDAGPQPVLRVFRSTAEGPRAAPVRIAAGALGPGVPARDVVVSPQHRLLLRSTVAARQFGTREVLVAALRLVGLPGIAREPAGPVSYVHLLFDRHVLLRAHGAWSESLLLAPMSLRGIGAAARLELLRDFPDEVLGRRPMVSARPILPGPEARRLLRRLAAAGRPPVEPTAEPTAEPVAEPLAGAPLDPGGSRADRPAMPAAAGQPAEVRPRRSARRLA